VQFQKKGNPFFKIKNEIFLSGSGTIYVGCIKLSNDNAYGLGRRLNSDSENRASAPTTNIRRKIIHKFCA